MRKIHRYVKYLLFVVVLFVLAGIPMQTLSNPESRWDDAWEYNLQIHIPIDTSQQSSIHQPIDQQIIFPNTCWGIDETSHSIRVACFHDGMWDELESQIYDINFDSNSVISSCRVVFLIPEYADGKESYYVYYHDEETSSSEYRDHVSISESFYRYEPISGYPLESSYYKIKDDDAIPYLVSQQGQFMGYNTGQHVTKMLDDITEIHPKNGDLFAGFDFKYSYDHGVFDYSSTSQKLMSKEIFVDGNLMVSFGMVSTSKKEDLRSTITYTYYHCPSTTTRMRVHVKHETLSDATTLMGASTDGVFASLQSGGVKSSSIKDLNIGEILPFMHGVNEFNEVFSYQLDVDPEYIPEDPDIRLVSYFDDVDLGDQPWVSFNEGSEGLAHALLFHSNEVLVSGEHEKDGLQLNMFQMDYPHLPGLENNIATMQIGRNSYEPGEGHDINIPSDFLVEFDAEFFTSREHGVDAVKQEKVMFNQLIEDVSADENEYDDEDDSDTTYSLSVILFQTPSFPFGSALSALTGFNLSYVTAELYENNGFLSSETAVRIPLNPLNPEDESLLNKIKAVVGIIDYRNISLLKSVEFSSVKPGEYTVKIFVDNQRFGSNKKFVGFASVNISDEDEIIFIRGSRERSVDFTVLDQDGEQVKDAQVSLLKDEVIVSSGYTDEQGSLTLSIPQTRGSYTVEVSLHGIQVFSETMNTRLFMISSSEYKISIKRYDVTIDLSDTWGLPLGVDVTPIVLNTYEESIQPDETPIDSSFLYTSLPPSSYDIIVKYKSVTYKESINLQADTSLKVSFPAAFHMNISFLDNHGLSVSDVTYVIQREGIKKTYQTRHGTVEIEVPPGEYETEVYRGEELVGKRDLMITGNGIQQYITAVEPSYPLLLTIGVILGGCGLGYWFYQKRKKRQHIFLVISMVLLLISLLYPWWSIHGSTESVETMTHLFLIPSKLVTVTASSAFIVGDQGFLPDLFIMMIQGVIGLILGAVCLLLIMMGLQQRLKKKTGYIHIVTLLVLIGVIGIFLFGMATLSEVTVGSFIGEGVLDISIGGQDQYEQIPCNWGPSIGFYLVIASVISVLFPLLTKLKVFIGKR